jgi:hypothetical protein
MAEPNRNSSELNSTILGWRRIWVIVRQSGVNYGGVVKVDYTVQVWKEGGQFVAHAMPLDVASRREF